MAVNANELFMLFNKAAMALLHAVCLRMLGPGHRLEKEGSGGTVAYFHLWHISDILLEALDESTLDSRSSQLKFNQTYAILSQGVKLLLS